VLWWPWEWRAQWLPPQRPAPTVHRRVPPRPPQPPRPRRHRARARPPPLRCRRVPVLPTRSPVAHEHRLPAAVCCASSRPISECCNAIWVTTPMARQTSATRQTTPATSRARSDRRDGARRRRRPESAGSASAASAGRFQHVTRPAGGVDHGRPAYVDRLAEVGDVGLDDGALPATRSSTLRPGSEPSTAPDAGCA